MLIVQKHLPNLCGTASHSRGKTLSRAQLWLCIINNGDWLESMDVVPKCKCYGIALVNSHQDALGVMYGNDMFVWY